MTPAEIVIHKFGGVRKLSRLLGISPSSVCRWRKDKSMGGTGGRIPNRHYKTIFDLAVENNVKLKISDLFWGNDK